MKSSKTKFRSKCTITRSLDLIGDKWTLLIIRDIMLNDMHTFSSFLSSENMPTNILTNRLRKLIDLGFCKRVIYQKKPVRYGYYLTDLGESLRPVVITLQKWGKNNIPNRFLELGHSSNPNTIGQS